MTSVFHELVSVSGQLGLPTSPAVVLHDSHDATAVVEALRSFVTARRDYVQALAKAQQMKDHVAVNELVDSGLQQHRSDQLSLAADTLSRMVDHTDTLALRFKDSSARQTLPIEPEHQAEFLELLKSAGRQGWVQHGLDDLAWAASFSEPPHTWEQALAALSTMHSTCDNYQKQLDKFSKTLSQHCH